MDPEKVHELIERILSASMQELVEIGLELDQNNCPEEILVAWYFRCQEIWDEADRRYYEMVMRQAEEKARAKQNG